MTIRVQRTCQSALHLLEKPHEESLYLSSLDPAVSRLWSRVQGNACSGYPNTYANQAGIDTYRTSTDANRACPDAN